MAFTIKFHGKTTKSFDDDHVLKVTDSGVIEVRNKSGEQVGLYSPTHWAEVVPGARKKTARPRVAQIR